MTADFEHDARPHQWVHPETGVRINCEDMPDELLPHPAGWQTGLSITTPTP